MPTTSHHYEARCAYPKREIGDFPCPPRDLVLLFTGFFMGDGSCGLGRSRHDGMGGYFAYHPHVAVCLRRDNRAILDVAVTYFGGKVHSTPSAKRLVTWNLTGMERMERFLMLMLDAVGDAPFKKARDVQLLLAYIQWRINGPFRLSPEDRLVQDDYYHKLRAVKELDG